MTASAPAYDAEERPDQPRWLAEEGNSVPQAAAGAAASPADQMLCWHLSVR